MKMKTFKRCSLLWAASMLSLGVSAGQLSNFQEPNTAQLVKGIQQHQLNVVQFGDSHTAADYMSNALRTTLQNQLGNGGMGWGMPMYFSGQRLTRFGYDNSHWQPISIRSQPNANYTLGGLLARPLTEGATLTIKAKQSEQRQKITVSIRQGAQDSDFVGVDSQGQRFSLSAPVKNNTWQLQTFEAQLPFTITAPHNPQSVIGGWWAKNATGSGAVVSALGINGAQLQSWNNWNSAWKQQLGQLKFNLIILAYGTNEAYNRYDLEQERQILLGRIHDIREASPQSAILIVSAPESLKDKSGECGTRPAQLTQFQTMQREVATQAHTLFWDWQAAMGGSCSMKNWMERGDAARDGVHFSASGYTQLGDMLGNDILALAGQSAPTTTRSSAVAALPKSGLSVKNNTVSSLGYASICDVEDQNSCKTIH